MPMEFKSQKDMEAFLPTEGAIRKMQAKYPIHGAFIVDMMMSPNSAAGWFLAGFLFGRDRELRQEFDHMYELIGAKGVQRTMYDA